MNSLTLTSQLRRPYAMDWRGALSAHPMWWWSICGYTLLMLACLIGMGVDERTLFGVSVWSKPFKFSLSLVVYFATLALAAMLVPAETQRGRTFFAVLTLSTSMALLEMIYITYQAALGEPSHFNFTSTFNALMYSLMGFGATVMVLVLLALAWLIGRKNRLSQPLILATVLGLIFTFVLGGGFGGYMGSQGGHWVGTAASDANGTAMFNWSTLGGDLRVAHFFGMHAMQVIPGFAILLGMVMPRKSSENTHNTLIISFTVAYVAFSTMTFIQAVQGKPFIGT